MKRRLWTRGKDIQYIKTHSKTTRLFAIMKKGTGPHEIPPIFINNCQ